MCVMFSSFYLNRSNEKYKLHVVQTGLCTFMCQIHCHVGYPCGSPLCLQKHTTLVHILTCSHTCTLAHPHTCTSTQQTSVLFQLQTLNILSACSTSVAIETRVSVQHGCRVHHTDHTHQGPSCVYEHQGDL